MMTKPDLTLTAKFDRDFASMEGGSVRYLVTRLKAVSPTAEKERKIRRPLNFALVIDASGSMGAASLRLPSARHLGFLTGWPPR